MEKINLEEIKKRGLTQREIDIANAVLNLASNRGIEDTRKLIQQEMKRVNWVIQNNLNLLQVFSEYFQTKYHQIENSAERCKRYEKGNQDKNRKNRQHLRVVQMLDCLIGRIQNHLNTSGNLQLNSLDLLSKCEKRQLKHQQRTLRYALGYFALQSSHEGVQNSAYSILLVNHLIGDVLSLEFVYQNLLLIGSIIQEYRLQRIRDERFRE